MNIEYIEVSIKLPLEDYVKASNLAHEERTPIDFFLVQTIQTTLGTFGDDESVQKFITTYIHQRIDNAQPIATASLYNLYRDWCEHRNHTPLTRKRFTRELAKAGFRRGVRTIAGRSMNCILNAELKEGNYIDNF